jgi:dynein heavy chain 1, cytosolic
VSTVDYPKINEWLTRVEKAMRMTLASYLAEAVQDIKQFKEGSIDSEQYMKWCDKYQAQIVVLAAQILWSEDVEAALKQMEAAGPSSPSTPLERVLAQVQTTLTVLADSVLQEQPQLRRKKLEHLVRYI